MVCSAAAFMMKFLLIRAVIMAIMMGVVGMVTVYDRKMV